MEDQVDEAEIDSYIKKPGENDESADGADAGPPNEDAEEDGEESDPNAFEVETIKAVRKAKKGNKYEYKVSWKGYGSDDDTWEPRENLQCDELLKAFESSEEGKRMFAECQKTANAPLKRSSTAASAQKSSKSTARGQNKSGTRASTPDFDDDGNEDDWSSSKKRKTAGGAAASGTKPAVRRRYTTFDDDEDDETKVVRGRGGGKSAKSSALDNSSISVSVSSKTRLPTDKITKDFLKNDLNAIRGVISKEKLDDTDYDSLSRIGVAAVRPRNPIPDKLPKNAAATRDYGTEWKRKTTAEGVKSGYVLRSIIQLIMHGNELTYLVDWKNTKNIDVVEHAFLQEFYPREVFDFIIDRTEMQSEEVLNLQQSKASDDAVSNGFKNGEDDAARIDDDTPEAAPTASDADEVIQQIGDDFASKAEGDDVGAKIAAALEELFEGDDE